MEFSSRLPEKAKIDLMEFFPKTYKKLPETSKPIVIDKHLDLIKAILGNRLNVKDIIDNKNQARITDDRPYNEYFLLRKIFKFEKH